jgi:hypothetical protein
LKSLRRWWCLGSEAFKKAMLRQAEEGLGENHSGEQRWKSAVAKWERIFSGEIQRLRRKQEALAARRKSDPEKVAIALRRRRETTLTIKHIASRLSLGDSQERQHASAGVANHPLAPNTPSPFTSGVNRPLLRTVLVCPLDSSFAATLIVSVPKPSPEQKQDANEAPRTKPNIQHLVRNFIDI